MIRVSSMTVAEGGKQNGTEGIFGKGACLRRQAGFADCEVYYRGGKAFEVLILEGEVSDYENSREEGLAFRETSTDGQAMPIPSS